MHTQQTSPQAEHPRHSTGQGKSTSPSASVPSLRTQSPLYASRNQWPRLRQPQPRQLNTVLVTSQPSAWAHKTHGALSAATTIATTVDSCHAVPRLPTPPHEPHGMAAATPTAVFTLCFPVSTHSQIQRRSTSSKRSATHRGSPPQNPSFVPRPPSTTTCHVPPFNPFQQATFLKR